MKDKDARQEFRCAFCRETATIYNPNERIVLTVLHPCSVCRRQMPMQRVEPGKAANVAP